MKRYRVIISQSAERDLFDLAAYTSARSSLAIADRFVAAIEAYCLGLTHAPQRGRSLARGQRMVGFERRASIIFRIDGDVVRVLRIAYRGRDAPKLGDRR